MSKSYCPAFSFFVVRMSCRIFVLCTTYVNTLVRFLFICDVEHY